MIITFNPYYQDFRRFFFRNDDKQFNQSCNKLENDVDDLFCIIDKQGKTKFIEECSKRILGHSINKKYKYIFFEMYGSFIKKLFRKKFDLKNIIPSYVEFSIKNSHDKYLCLRLNFQSILINNELLIMVIAKDVTKKRELLEEFGENNLWSKSIIENIKLGVMMEDKNGTIISLNKRFMEIFKIEANPKDFIGTKCSDAMETVKDLFMEPDTFVQSTNKIIRDEKELIDEVLKLKNGQVIERSFFQFKSNLAEIRCFWIYNDVTEYHKLFNLLTEKEARYRGILENTQLGILEIDDEGVITNASRIFCKMSGYEKNQLIGIRIEDGLLCDDSTTNHLMTVVKNYIPNTYIKNAYEFQLITRNGSKLWVLVSTAPAFNNENQVTGYTSFYYDITERKLLEQSLRLANTSSRKAEESEKLFVASMTHELKTPINAIVGMGDLLKLTALNEEQTEYVEILDTSTKYLQKLVCDILDMSKIESGFIELRKDPFNLMDLLLQIARSFDHGLAKNNINLKIKLDFRSTLEILDDKTILQQIISNLLSNAEKFTQKGSITLSVEQIEETNQNIKLKFIVKDTGIGFNENMKDLIFEKFTQLPSMNQHKSPGVGLGLNIVKQLLSFKGSKIEVKTEIGEGSEFSFDLFFEKNKFSTHIVTQNKKRNFDNPFNNIKILVVEDNELNLQYLAKVLSKWSIDFDVATSGEVALTKFQKKEYDLVLLDLQLPGINGFETASRLRSLFQNQIYTIIAMTAVVTADIEREILKYGMNDIIRKPFSIDDLYDKIALFFLVDIKSSTNEIFCVNSLDSKFLHQFYNEDYNFALSVFETFRNSYLREFKEIIASSNKVPQSEIDFRLHRIKPSFKMIGMADIEKEIEKYITRENKSSNELMQIFTDVKVCNIEMVLNMQIDILKKIVLC